MANTHYRQLRWKTKNRHPRDTGNKTQKDMKQKKIKHNAES